MSISFSLLLPPPPPPLPPLPPSLFGVPKSRRVSGEMGRSHFEVMLHMLAERGKGGGGKGLGKGVGGVAEVSSWQISRTFIVKLL